MTLGEKISKRRRALGMTQAQLAADKITRNMVSLLENDLATPSVDTLVHLSAALKIDPAYFLCEGDDTFVYEKLAVIREIRDAYAKKKHDIVMKRIENLGQTDDELAYLAANAAAMLGFEKMRLGSLASAREHLAKAVSYARKTVYDTSLLEAKIALWQAICDNIHSPRLHFDEHTYERTVREQTDNEFYRYFLTDLDFPYTDPILSRHIEAKRLMRAHAYPNAIPLLTEAEEMGKDKEIYHAFVMLGVYTDLEICCRECGNFEQAYRYSTRRLSMAEWFKT